MRAQAQAGSGQAGLAAARSVNLPIIFVPSLKEIVPVGVPMKEKVGVTVVVNGHG